MSLPLSETALTALLAEVHRLARKEGLLVYHFGTSPRVDFRELWFNAGKPSENNHDLRELLNLVPVALDRSTTPIYIGCNRHGCIFIGYEPWRSPSKSSR